jgi:diguanylate cyclase (GGDEF)-like protein
VRAQLTAVVAVVALLIGGAGAWLATMTLNEAEAGARRNASFQAGLGAAAVTDALAQALQAIAGLANGLPIAALLAEPAKCQLTFSGLGVFSTGHIDVVLADGRVPCSSLRTQGAPAGASQAGAAWLQDARSLREPRVAGLFDDRLTSGRALAVTAPIPAVGAAPAAFATVVLPLAGLGDGLDRTYGGPQRFTFTVRAATGDVLIGEPGPASDVIVGQRAIPELGWVLDAEQPRQAALAATRLAFERLAGLAAAALTLLALLLAFLNRRIGRPLRLLTSAMARGPQMSPERLPERGPRELRALASGFNEMISAREGYETQLVHHALHDPLTGLPNRALGLDRIAHALQVAAGRPAAVAVLSVDLDRFKLVNASLGHRVGDEVLQASAVRLAACLESTDTLARSGDGFVVCRPDAQDSHAPAALAGRLIASIVEPFTIAGTDVTLTASVGVAHGRRGASAEQLLRDADTALYAAKETGGGRFRLIDDELRERSSERLGLESDLRGALARGELHVAYQPVVNLLTGQITGAEALLRWTHPVRGPVSPVTFIPLAESAGLIGPIGLFVLDEACRQAVAWTSEGHPLRIAVNMSGLQLHAAGFAESVRRTLDTSGLDPSQLCLELTESVLMDDAMHGADVLRELKDIGVFLSVDDFGTGYSSLAYLKRFPVDELKIDRFFVQTLRMSGEDHSLVAAMVAMGHALGLQVVAEGVETEPQRGLLLTLGCRSAQGYLFSKPVSAHRVSSLLAHNSLARSH